MKKILIITAVANDVFISNFALWLKKMTDAEIDIMYFYDVKEQVCDLSAYHESFLVSADPGIHGKIRSGRNLRKKMLEVLEGRHYDVIQCHGALGRTIVLPELKKYCGKLCLTFWGGEEQTQKCYGHRSWYPFFLKRFFKKMDYLINSTQFNSQIIEKYPMLEGKTRTGYLGSAPLENLYRLMGKESKADSKEKMGISRDKTTVQIGYSGKKLHRHAEIIKEMQEHPELAGKIHILAPMTRGAQTSYVNETEVLLEASGFSYTLLRDRFLTDEEVARLRNATDIVLQMSEYDGFSRSLVECMCARAIMIYGEWLDYDISLETNGLQAIRTDGIASAVRLLPEIAAHPEQYDEMLENNSRNGKKHNCWSECIKDWIEIYNG